MQKKIIREKNLSSKTMTKPIKSGPSTFRNRLQVQALVDVEKYRCTVFNHDK